MRTESGSLHRFGQSSVNPRFLLEHATAPIYQTSFRANWICREVVAVEVI
jgi:hypothetical protein